MPLPNETIKSALESHRNRLLDLTARNRLLNLKDQKAASLPLRCADLSASAAALAAGRELRLEAVPEAAAGGETGSGGDPRAAPSADGGQGLESERRPRSGSPSRTATPQWVQRKVQAPGGLGAALDEEQLSGRLRQLAANARRIESETGVQVLHLTLGLLEWGHAGAEGLYAAPVLTLPVRLNRGRLDANTGRYAFTLSGLDETPELNLTLQEKLRRDFGLELPAFGSSAPAENGAADASMTEAEPNPAAYLEALARWLSEVRPEWRVRPEAWLALLDFTRLRMHLDLDPEHWPEGRKIEAHPLVQRALGFSLGPGPEETAPEWAPADEAEAQRRYPLIADADSSQFAALRAALDGRDLVLIGPPGTGKSQTITNLIAGALAQGQRVLFVAEKLAALEVVKARLDRAGLGAFGLELHSHRAVRSQVIEGLRERLEELCPGADGFETEAAGFARAHRALQRHAAGLNRPWGATGWRAGEILLRATRLREGLGLDPLPLHPPGLGGAELDPQTRERHRSQAEMAAATAAALLPDCLADGGLRGHPWCGVCNTALPAGDDGPLRDLAAWQAGLQGLEDWRAACARGLGLDAGAIASNPEGLEQLHDALAGLPAAPAPALLTGLPRLDAAARGLLRQHLALAQEDTALRAELAAVLHAEAMGLLQDPTPFAADWALVQTRLGPEADLDALAAALPDLQRLSGLVTELAQRIEPLRQALGAERFPLCESGLEDFAEVLALAAALPAPLWSLRAAFLQRAELDRLLPELGGRIAGLRQERAELSRWLNLAALPPLQALKGRWLQAGRQDLLRWASRDWHAARREIAPWRAAPGVSFSELRAALPRAIRLLEARAELEADPRAAELLGERFRGLDTDIETLSELRDWVRRVQGRFGGLPGPRAALEQLVLQLPEDRLQALARLHEQGVGQQLRERLQALGRWRRSFANARCAPATQSPLLGAAGLLMQLHQELEAALAPCLARFRPQHPRLNQVLRWAEALGRLGAIEAEWAALEARSNGLAAELGLGLGQGHAAGPNAGPVQDLLRLAEALDEDPRLAPLAVRERPLAAFFSEIDARRRELSAALDRQRQAAEAFGQRMALNAAAWTSGLDGAIESLMRRNARALERPEALDRWLRYRHHREELAALGYAGLLNALEEGLFPPEDLLEAWELALTDRLAQEIREQAPEVFERSGTEIETLRAQLARHDQGLQRAQQGRIAARLAQRRGPEGLAGPRAGDKTEMALVQHECAKQQRYIPIRELLSRAGESVQALKPCFLMSPLSVAQYLPPGALEFDLVVMDEASQVRPEDALGALARAKQLVVVGDPQQLPPSDFFARSGLDEDAEDTATQENAESILEAMLPQCAVRQLNWHYRSRHQDLIAFSNRHFYQNRLAVFPSAAAATPGLGLDWVRLPNGLYADHKNPAEAEAAAEAVREALINRPEESLGVVAMNIAQRGLIEDEIEKLAQQDAAFRTRYEAAQHAPAPFFVKNLENVQGDERDHIIISLTYGPTRTGGGVAQRFGPINRAKGARRLNVLFSRAKRRMQVLGSMSAADITANGDGPKALRAFLEFAENTDRGSWSANADKRPVNDFAEALAARLEQAGHPCVRDLSAGGVRIDVAVEDPNRPDGYRLGIQCDANIYPHTTSIRDADRLIPEVLKGLHWRIQRVSARDWRLYPEMVLRELLSTLENERQRYRQDHPEESKTMSLFSERLIEEGVQLGAHRGEAKTLLKQLALKFGPVPQAVCERVETADEAHLQQWLERVLTAETLDEVFD